MIRSALIIAHGQPSDPAPPEAELRILAAKVAALLPGWQLHSATLAAPGALGQAIEKITQSGADLALIYPLFMASGWFTRSAIPARLAEADPSAAAWPILAPFGEDPKVEALALRIIRDSAAREVLLAAHGSFKSPVPAAIADALAQKIGALPGVTRAEAAFIDQNPRLADMRGFAADAVCLPFFAMAGGHVTEDLPQALQEAGFTGRILPPLGHHDLVPECIAEALLAAAGPQK